MLQFELWKAIREDNVEMLKSNYKLSVENGVKGESLLRYALQVNNSINGSDKVIKCLLKDLNIDITGNDCVGDNLFHIVCQKKIISDEIFQLIIQKMSPKLMHEISHTKENSFLLACKFNSLHRIKQLYEELNFNIHQKNVENRGAIHYAALNQDLGAIKYITNIYRGEGLDIYEEDNYGMNALFISCKNANLDIFLYLFDLFLHKSIPNNYPINIFHFIVDRFYSIIKKSFPLNIKKIEVNFDYNFDRENQEKYQEIIEENYQLIITNKNKIWEEVLENQNIEIIQFIYSLKGINIENSFLIACENRNLKALKYLYKNFSLNINQITSEKKNAFHIAYKYYVRNSIKIFHYLYLIGVDIHHISLFGSVYDITADSHEINLINYFKVISQDFNYQNNPHDNVDYPFPNFWKKAKDFNDEKSRAVIEWKNRFEEHVLRHLSKMIQNSPPKGDNFN